MVYLEMIGAGRLIAFFRSKISEVYIIIGSIRWPWTFCEKIIGYIVRISFVLLSDYEFVYKRKKKNFNCCYNNTVEQRSEVHWSFGDKNEFARSYFLPNGRELYVI